MVNHYDESCAPKVTVKVSTGKHDYAGFFIIR